MAHYCIARIGEHSAARGELLPDPTRIEVMRKSRFWNGFNSMFWIVVARHLGLASVALAKYSGARIVTEGRSIDSCHGDDGSYA